MVVPRPGAALDGEAMVADLKARIANFKVPKRVFVVAELPRQCDGQGAEEPAAQSEQHKGGSSLAERVDDGANARCPRCGAAFTTAPANRAATARA